MRKQVYMAMVVMAAVMLLAVPFIPHHHHERALCTIVEHCDSDNTDNDEHTSHNDDGTACIEKGGFFLSKSDVHDNTNHEITPALASATHKAASVELYPTKRVPCEWKGVSIYQSVELSRINALRAPPLTLL